MEMVPSLWRRLVGASGLGRWATALLGGILIGIGARWADGCTSGHGISSTLQLVASSWVEVIMGQLLLKDWTAIKVMMSAVATGMVGIYLLKIPRLVRLHKQTGSLGATVIGGLIFGVGFAVLGYCPGTLAGYFHDERTPGSSFTGARGARSLILICLSPSANANGLKCPAQQHFSTRKTRRVYPPDPIYPFRQLGFNSEHQFEPVLWKGGALC